MSSAVDSKVVEFWKKSEDPLPRIAGYLVENDFTDLIDFIAYLLNNEIADYDEVVRIAYAYAEHCRVKKVCSEISEACGGEL